MGAPTIDQVVSSHHPQESKPDETSVVDNIFHQLNDEEREQAARASSYRYLLAAESLIEEEGADQRDRHAKATIKRYVTAEKNLNTKSPDEWEVTVTMKLKKTLAYRAEKQVDDIRLCFDEEKRSDDATMHAAMRKGLEDRFARGNSIIRGFTKDGIAIFHNTPRTETSWDREYYIKGNIYMLERALACTERNTNGEKDKALVFYDYSGYGMKNSPPVHLVKELLHDLRDHWPERLQHVFLVDSPFIFRAFWAIVKHFVDPITKELVQFVTGEEQKKILRDLVADDQAMPYMFDGGKDGEEADMKIFFYDTPFDHVYCDRQD